VRALCGSFAFGHREVGADDEDELAFSADVREGFDVGGGGFGFRARAGVRVRDRVGVGAGGFGGGGGGVTGEAERGAEAKVIPDDAGEDGGGEDGCEDSGGGGDGLGEGTRH